MKIIHLIDQFGYADGCARAVYFLIQEQIKNGYDITLVTGFENAPELIKRLKCEVIVVPEISHEFRTKKRFIKGIIILRKLIKKKKPDVVHAHHYYSAFQFYIARIGVKILLVQTVHALMTIKGKIPQYIGDKIITVTNAIAEMVKKAYPKLQDRIVTVYNSSCFIGLENNLNNSDILKKIVAEKNSKKIILYSGRIVQEKGIELLIRAINSLIDIQQYKLLIVGAGAMRGEYEILAKNLNVNAIWLGEIPDIKKVLEISDLLVLPSHKWEGMPMVLLEAGLLAKPVIASDIPGLSELIYDDENGLLFEPGNAVDLANKIEFILNNEKKAEQLGKELQKKIKSEHTIEIMFNKVDKVYKELLLESK